MFKDERLEARQKTFQKSTNQLLSHREKFNLTLRKEKLDKFIYEKRMKTNNYQGDFTNINENLNENKYDNINKNKLSLNSFSINPDIKYANIKSDDLVRT